jgi:hypothetical protein
MDGRLMKVGFDYWNVISHHPEKIAFLMRSIDFGTMVLSDTPWHVHVISAVGRSRVGTVEQSVDEILKPYIDRKFYKVHEVVFKSSKESPELKLAKCKELGIDIFFDDRQDVCDLLNVNGILALRVPRKENKTDIEAEQK